MKFNRSLLIFLIYFFLLSTAFAKTNTQAQKDKRKELELQLQIKQQQLALRKLDKQLQASDQTTKEEEKTPVTTKPESEESEAFNPTVGISAQLPFMFTMNQNLAKAIGVPKGGTIQLLFPKIHLAVSYSAYYTQAENTKLNQLHQLISQERDTYPEATNIIESGITARTKGSIMYQLAQVAVIAPIFSRAHLKFGVGVGSFSSEDLNMKVSIQEQTYKIGDLMPSTKTTTLVAAKIKNDKAMSLDIGFNYAVAQYFGIDIGYSLIYAKVPVVLSIMGNKEETGYQSVSSNVFTAGTTLFF